MFAALSVKALLDKLFASPDADPMEVELTQLKFEFALRILEDKVGDMDPDLIYKLHGLFRRICDGPCSIMYYFSCNDRTRAWARASLYSEYEAMVEYVREMEEHFGAFNPEMYDPSTFNESSVAKDATSTKQKRIMLFDCSTNAPDGHPFINVREHGMETLQNVFSVNHTENPTADPQFHNSNSAEYVRILRDHGFDARFMDHEEMSPVDIVVQCYDDIEDMINKCRRE